MLKKRLEHIFVFWVLASLFDRKWDNSWVLKLLLVSHLLKDGMCAWSLFLCFGRVFRDFIACLCFASYACSQDQAL